MNQEHPHSDLHEAATALLSRPPQSPEETRQQLVLAAFLEMHEQGFRNASLSRILDRVGVTKGALYHHFKNKLELGYAVIEEVIKPMVVTEWVQALADTDDPLEAIKTIIRERRAEHGETVRVCGCPLNNLAMEMSPIDEGFRLRIQALFGSWQRGIASALRQGQAHGKVRQGVDADQIATFILASIEGTIGLGKNAQSMDVFEASFAGLDLFLDSLRPTTADA